MTELLGAMGAAVVAVVTYALGRRRDRLAHLRAAQIDAIVHFCDAVMHYSAAQLKEARWTDAHPDEEPIDPAIDDQVRACRSDAWAAYYRVVLLVGEADSIECKGALDLAYSITKVEGGYEKAKETGESVREATEGFVVKMTGIVGGKQARHGRLKGLRSTDEPESSQR